MHTRRQLLKTIGAVAAAPIVLTGAPAIAQTTKDWPNRPIRLVVPVAPGGVYDAQARLVAEKLSTGLGQQVIVENKPGAEGRLGTAAVANAAPDGYTVLMCGSTIVQGLVFSRDAQYKLAQFTPLGMCCWLPIGFGIHAELPVDTLPEFVKLAGSKAMSYGSIAVSTRGIGETFKHAAGIDLTHIGYKGEAPLTTDLIAGHVQSGFMTSGGFKQWYGKGAGGKIKWLAVTTTKRMTRFPDVPTFTESGYPQVDMSAWLGFVMPAGTPREIVDRMAVAIGQAMQSTDVTNRILDLGVEPNYLPAAAFGAFIDDELRKWTRIQKETGIEVT